MLLMSSILSLNKSFLHDLVMQVQPPFLTISFHNLHHFLSISLISATFFSPLLKAADNLIPLYTLPRPPKRNWPVSTLSAFLRDKTIMATLHPWPDQTLSSNKTRVIRELVQGQKCAAQLQIIVDQQHSQQGSSPEELLQKILTCFDQTISMLQDACRTPVPAPAAVSKERRGCYKRKRGAETWTIVSDKMEDDHAWRKYGQKTILNSKHPRSYFRCKHKCDQGCRAMKQVQRTEDDDSKMYHITYIGTHTCRDSSPHDMAPSNNSGIPFDGSSPTLKHGYEEVMTPSDVTELDSMTMWEDVVLGGDGFESMYGDVVSDMYSCKEVSCLNLEPIGLENGFQLDDSEFV